MHTVFIPKEARRQFIKKYGIKTVAKTERVECFAAKYRVVISHMRGWLLPRARKATFSQKYCQLRRENFPMLFPTISDTLLSLLEVYSIKQLGYLKLLNNLLLCIHI